MKEKQGKMMAEIRLAVEMELTMKYEKEMQDVIDARIVEEQVRDIDENPFHNFHFITSFLYLRLHSILLLFITLYHITNHGR